MQLIRNQSGQKWRIFAFNRNTSVPVTGDAANITAKIEKDYAGPIALDDTNPTEKEDGFYDFDLTQAESNGLQLGLFPESTTTNVQVVAVPAVVTTKTNPAGHGSQAQALIIEDSTGNTLFGVQVWVTTTPASPTSSNNLAGGPLYTDSLGRVTFLLNPGTYYRWADKNGYEFVNPQSFVVA